MRRRRNMSPAEFAAWFWDKVTGPPDECWPWVGATHDKGYGSLGVDGRTTTTHRLAYTLAIGPIPAGMHVLHHCDNPPCCNPGPGHLFLGTNRENIADMVAKGRNAHGNAYPQTKLTPEAVVEIRRRAAAGETHDALGREFGVCRVNVTRVVGRRLWAQVAD